MAHGGTPEQFRAWLIKRAKNCAIWKKIELKRLTEERFPLRLQVPGPIMRRDPNALLPERKKGVPGDYLDYPIYEDDSSAQYPGIIQDNPYSRMLRGAATKNAYARAHAVTPPPCARHAPPLRTAPQLMRRVVSNMPYCPNQCGKPKTATKTYPLTYKPASTNALIEKVAYTPDTGPPISFK